MQISKWGNSLAVRLPKSIIEGLNLKEGEHIELHLVGERDFEVARAPDSSEMLERLRKLRGRLPAGFHFDRIEANQRASEVE